jgi:hypothetical protein
MEILEVSLFPRKAHKSSYINNITKYGLEFTVLKSIKVKIPLIFGICAGKKRNL